MSHKIYMMGGAKSCTSEVKILTDYSTNPNPGVIYREESEKYVDAPWTETIVFYGFSKKT